MTLVLRQEVLRLPFRDPFVIARAHAPGGVSTTVVVELESDRHPGIVGYGEGYPDPFYGETPATIAVVLPLLLDQIETVDAELEAATDPVALLERVEAAISTAIGLHGGAKCALSIALHDLVGKVVGRPLVDLLGLSRDIPPTDFTLGLDEPAVVAERARRASAFPALKIKVGGEHDLRTLEAVREVYGRPLRVDANTGWTRETATRLLPELERLGVELIEQPFPARRLDDLRWLQERTTLPVVADESAVFPDDLDALVGVVAGINVKLAKCGGIGPARATLERARALGFRTFLGCMEETSVVIAASAALGSLADWVDLDGSLLLADDPFEGLELGEGAVWRLPDRPGLGVRRRVAAGMTPAPAAG